MIFWKVIAVMTFLVMLSIEVQLRKIAEYFENRSKFADEAIKFAKELNSDLEKELKRKFEKEKEQ